MKGTITLTLTAKDALALISGTVPSTITKKVVAALKVSNVTPVGKKASLISKPVTTNTKGSKATASQAIA